ncbi:MAG: HNH endonuclease [Rhodospirillales bacterium]|nr:HNH endonuclease [Rhodospirillales bacterium]
MNSLTHLQPSPENEERYLKILEDFNETARDTLNLNQLKEERLQEAHKLKEQGLIQSERRLSQTDKRLAQREKELEQRETALEQRETALEQSNTELEQRQKGLEHREQSLAQREVRMGQRERTIDQMEKARKAGVRHIIPARGPRRHIYRLTVEQAGSCAICKKPLPDFADVQIDHIRRVADGGGDEIENLQAVCAGCNRAKG